MANAEKVPKRSAQLSRQAFNQDVKLLGIDVNKKDVSLLGIDQNTSI